MRYITKRDLERFKIFADIKYIGKNIIELNYAKKTDLSEVTDKVVTKDVVGKANGVASLDATGNIPLEQLGNVDNQIFVITNKLPTESIDGNKIYIIPSEAKGDSNIYTEYCYINNVWEKLGEFKAEVDLSEYAKKTTIPTKTSQLINDVNFVERITYNKKTSTDDTRHTDIERAIETPLIIGGKKNNSSSTDGDTLGDDSLYLQNGTASFEDGTGSFIKLTQENVDIHADYSIHIDSNVYLGSNYSTNGAGFYYTKSGYLDESILARVNRFNITSPSGDDIAQFGRGVDTSDIKFWSSNGIYFSAIKNNLHKEFYLCDSNNASDDGLKILFSSEKYYNFSSTETRLLKDVITASKTQIRNRISSTCSTKLTEEKGFQVFTNLYADPEHCSDIADYTDTEKAILTSNTVQKNILDLNKKISSLTSSDTTSSTGFMLNSNGSIASPYIENEKISYCSSKGKNSIAIGFNAQGDYSYSIAIGSSSHAQDHGIALGDDASSEGDYSVAIGSNASSASIDSVVIGNGAACVEGEGNVAIGKLANSQFSSVALGNGVTACGANSIAIGADSSAHGDYSIALAGGYTNTDYSVAIGTACTSKSIFAVGANNQTYIEVDNENYGLYLKNLGGYDGTNLVNDNDELNPNIKSVQQVLADKADKTSIPTKVSQLTNDSGYTKTSELGTIETFKFTLEDGTVVSKKIRIVE